MTEYERLQELLYRLREIMPEIGENPVADEMYNMVFEYAESTSEDEAEWVHLPCKINDTFYYIGQYARNGRLTNDYCVCEGKVSSFEYGGVLTIYDFDGIDHSLGEVFLTKEKAEKALAEKEKQNEQCI